MTDRTLAELLIALAREDGVEPAAYAAVVEVESAGKPFEADGRTPRFLFERHKFFRALRGEAQARAMRAGLAHADWRPKSQYKDQRTSAARMALLARARAIDEEAANASCSWGVGQIMGSNARSLGYPSATAMVGAMQVGGVPEQVEAMIRFCRVNKLVRYLRALNWAAFARGFNGPGYAKNRYDEKLKAAYERISATLTAEPEPVALPPAPQLPTPPTRPDAARTVEDVKRVQARLWELRYFKVGKIDGDYGDDTRDAVKAFQRREGLSDTGDLDAATLERLFAPAPKPASVGAERAATTEEQVRAEGSVTVAWADRLLADAKVKAWVNRAGSGVGTFAAGASAWAVSLLSDWRVQVIIVCLLLALAAFILVNWWSGRRQREAARAIIEERVQAEREGRHAGHDWARDEPARAAA